MLTFSYAYIALPILLTYLTLLTYLPILTIKHEVDALERGEMSKHEYALAYAPPPHLNFDLHSHIHLLHLHFDFELHCRLLRRVCSSSQNPVSLALLSLLYLHYFCYLTY